MRIDISRIEGRLGLIGLAAFGLAHVLAPRSLLRIARRAYGLTLDIDFAPREGAPRRVRLVGLLSLLAWAVGRRVLRRSDDDRLGATVGFTEQAPLREHTESH